MAKLKLGPLPAELHCSLSDYADRLNSQHVHELWTGGETCRN